MAPCLPTLTSRSTGRPEGGQGAPWCCSTGAVPGQATKKKAIMWERDSNRCATTCRWECLQIGIASGRLVLDVVVSVVWSSTAGN